MVDQENKLSQENTNQDNPLSSNEIPDEQEGEFASAPVKPKHISITDEDLRNIQKETLEYKDKYLRLLADSENARKRLQKERQELTRYAVENFIVDMLRPIDNLENALRFAQDMSEEVRNWAFGFQMILAQFKDALNQNGVTSMDSLGKAFNPHDHEAVEMVESTTQPAGIIMEVCVPGYKMGDRTIRAAKVKVVKDNL